MAEEHVTPSDTSDQFFRELDVQLLVHELKSPLSLVEATTRTLLGQPSRLGPLTPRQEKALQRILRGAVRGRHLVEHLLEVGRADAAQFSTAPFRPADAVIHTAIDAVECTDGDLASRLEACIDDAEKLAVLADAGITVRVAPDTASLTILQDEVKFDLIVGNLIQNAVRFRRHLLDVALERAGDRLVVTVRDDGPGIAPEHHAAVFERYRQVHASDGLERKGHGLGLAGAQILAQRLGGEIALDSVPGQGATFRVSIPCGQADL